MIKDIEYKIGDTVYYVSRDMYMHQIRYGDRLTVVNLIEGILDDPYVTVITEEGKAFTMYYFRISKELSKVIA